MREARKGMRSACAWKRSRACEYVSMHGERHRYTSAETKRDTETGGRSQTNTHTHTHVHKDKHTGRGTNLCARKPVITPGADIDCEDVTLKAIGAASTHAFAFMFSS